MPDSSEHEPSPGGSPIERRRPGAAAAVGLGVGYLRSLSDVTIHEAGDVRHATSQPFLGQPPLATDEDFVSSPSQALVTSPHPEAGKTSAAILLARSLTTVGKNALLVEADLLDVPPVLPVADGRIPASQVDGVITILRSSRSHKSDATKACALLGAAGGRLLGSVLVSGRMHQGYGYHSYYGQEPRPVRQLETAAS